MFPGNLKKSLTRVNCAFDIIQEPGSYIKITDVKLKVPCGTAFLEIRDGSWMDIGRSKFPMRIVKLSRAS